MRALILGGTSDANLLADAIARARIDAIYSYAGRTLTPVAQPLPVRTGGFGGVPGFAEFIAREAITHVIDATHPFAAEMSQHAVEACGGLGVPLIALERSPWTPVEGDCWIEVGNIALAVDVLPEAPAQVFLAIGRQHLAPFATKPQHTYTLRFIDVSEQAPPFPDCEIIVSRGPFTIESEIELMRRRNIAWIVARNSGGKGARAKIDAARELGLPVVMIARPALPERRRVERVEDVLAWLGHEARLGA
jgi:precorrin-6A/cobalt-precorrin-6A reductase